MAGYVAEAAQQRGMQFGHAQDRPVPPPTDISRPLPNPDRPDPDPPEPSDPGTENGAPGMYIQPPPSSVVVPVPAAPCWARVTSREASASNGFVRSRYDPVRSTLENPRAFASVPDRREELALSRERGAGDDDGSTAPLAQPLERPQDRRGEALHAAIIFRAPAL